MNNFGSDHAGTYANICPRYANTCLRKKHDSEKKKPLNLVNSLHDASVVSNADVLPGTLHPTPLGWIDFNAFTSHDTTDVFVSKPEILGKQHMGK